ncbi:MAG: hypothetical protein IJM98_11570, partial [Oscillospiraceae bacterium]|nr:hypothetical protein [Oscillospiraceae bacterium]
VPPSPKGRLPFGLPDNPPFVFFAFGEKSTFPSGKAERNGQDRSPHLSLRGRKPVAIRKKNTDSSLRSE